MPDPRYLYKFRHFENPDHLRILTDDEFFFSSARHFNDPFDCRVPVRYDEGTRDDVIAHELFFFEHEFPNASQAQREAMAEEVYDSGSFRNSQEIHRAKRITQEYVLNRMGVFALTPMYANLLLWSHYSHSHTGFALGFLTQDLRNLAFTCTIATNHIMSVQQVRYNTRYPLLNAYRSTPQQRFDGQFHTKADDWRYEQEVRIFLNEGPDQKVTIPYDLVRRAILGCQATEANRNHMITILRNRRDQPLLFQAFKAEDHSDERGSV